jgi:hypothetical protein
MHHGTIKPICVMPFPLDQKRIFALCENFVKSGDLSSFIHEHELD